MTVTAAQAAPITLFRGRHSWASSFHRAPFYMPDTPHITSWPTREHYYQAAKALSGSDADWILSAPTPGEAKHRGRLVQLPAGWDGRKKIVMIQAVLTQFSAPYLPLQGLLLATDDALLIEGNRWGDDYWGAIPCDQAALASRPPDMPVWPAGSSWDVPYLSGHNWLGRILMMARDLVA